MRIPPNIFLCKLSLLREPVYITTGVSNENVGGIQTIVNVEHGSVGVPVAKEDDNAPGFMT